MRFEGLIDLEFLRSSQLRRSFAIKSENIGIYILSCELDRAN